MTLTSREQELLDLIRESPLSSPEELARKLGTTRTSVNVHVSNLVKKGALLGRGYVLGNAGKPHVVVVGGANMDLKARTLGPWRPATSNPGVTSQTPGGVGRNIAENLAHLGAAVSLISVVGHDPLGDTLLYQTAAAGVHVRGVQRLTGQGTGTYTAVLDHGGELVVAVAAMDIMGQLTPALLNEKRSLLAGAAWVVADGNLREDTLLQLLRLTTGTASRVVFEPVSVAKAVNLRQALQAGLVPYAVTPNLGELEAMVGETVEDTLPAIRSACAWLHSQGIELVWVRRGLRGSLLSLPDSAHELPALPAEVVDVTGAGDAMLAAFLAAALDGQDPLQAARLAHAAAALTVESPRTVVPLTLEQVSSRLEQASKDSGAHSDSSGKENP